MTEETTLHPSVPVNGKQLKLDRKAAGFTQASFSAECGSVSLVTVRRAEQGNRIIRTSLQAMARVLGQPAERYILSELSAKKNDFVISVAGQWLSFCVEADRGAQPYLVEETVTFEQQGNRITGTAHVTTAYEERQQNFDSTRIFHRVMIGVEFSREWDPPLGMSNFILNASRNNDWLEGFVSWYDVDSDQVETSRLIIVRHGCPGFEQYCTDARSIMNIEIAHFRLRKLTEAGYGLDEAFTMLSSLVPKGQET